MHFEGICGIKQELNYSFNPYKMKEPDEFRIIGLLLFMHVIMLVVSYN